MKSANFAALSLFNCDALVVGLGKSRADKTPWHERPRFAPPKLNTKDRSMQTAAEFLAEIEKYLDKHSIAPATFGRLIMGDPSFIFELRDGRAPSIDTCARISKIINNPQSAHLFYRPVKKT